VSIPKASSESSKKDQRRKFRMYIELATDDILDES
jgi:hypothetical protein